MPRKQLQIWLITVLILLIHQILQKIGYWEFPVVDAYLDPFLSLPILLGGILLERNFILRKLYSNKVKEPYHFSLFETIVLSIFFALLFEEGFPRWSQGFTQDEWDYVAYFFGSLLFYFYINQPPRKISF